MDDTHHIEWTEHTLNKSKKAVWGVGLFVAILSVSEWKTLLRHLAVWVVLRGRLSPHLRSVWVERQGPHTPPRNIYLSSWLDGLNDHPAEKGEWKTEKESLSRRWRDGGFFFFFSVEEMCCRKREQGHRSEKMPPIEHFEENKIIRMT